MPDFSASLSLGAVAPGARSAVLGAAAPFVARALSVYLAPMPLGAAAPMHAVGAGVLMVANGSAVAMSAMPLLASADVGSADATDGPTAPGQMLAIGQDILKFGINRFRGMRTDQLTEAAEAIEEVISGLEDYTEYYNKAAKLFGLPSAGQVSDKLLGMTETEGRLVGNDGSVNGLPVVTESTPAWLADP